jgi:hypothetical protein
MKRVKKMSILTAALLAATFAGRARAAETESSTISGTPIAGGFQYTMNLTNTSTDSSKIGTFWFAWVPGSDFMQAEPTGIVSPTGWTANITGAAANVATTAGDGNAIQWIAGTGSALAPGATDTFTFDSTETLAQLLGPSPFGGKPTETTSFIYTGGPFSDNGTEFTVVPEPATASLLALVGGGALLRRRRTA